MTGIAGSPRADAPQIQVWVHAEGGRGTPEATVTVLDEQGRQVTAGRVGADGAFRAPVPEPGAYLLIAAAPGHSPQTATVHVGEAQGSPVEVVFTDGTFGSVSGTVRTSGGEPIVGATVFVNDERGEVVTSCTAADGGAYAIEQLAPGSYTLVASAPGCLPASDLVAVTGQEPIVRDVTLAAAVALHGTARTADGRAIPDARVTLLDPQGHTVAVTDSGADGRYEFAGIPDGDYTLIATGFPPVADVIRLGGDGVCHDVQLTHRDPPPKPEPPAPA